MNAKKNIFNYLKIGHKPGKIPELDGLRAVAILMVLGHHFATFYREHNGSYYRQVIAGPLENWLLNGWLGVDLFFVLSGYLIFHHLLSVQDNPDRVSVFGRYALKRVLRTFPLYYGMLLVAALGLIPYFSPSVSGTDLAIHLLFLQDYYGTNILVPMWSLATEEKFYLLAPLLLVLGQRHLKRSIALLSVVILGMVVFRTFQIMQDNDLVGHIQFFLQYRAPFHYAVLNILVGVMVALVAHRPAPGVLRNLSLWLVGAVLLLLFGVDLYHFEQWQWLSVVHLLLVLCFGVMVWSAVKLTGTGWLRMLAGGFLRRVSVLSYALYLVHYAVLPWALQIHRHYVYSETPWVHALAFLLLYLGLTLLLSLILHYLIEKPFLILKDKF